MKVLQVASSLYEWGGIERYVVYLSQGLEAKGHDLFVACPPGSPIAQRYPRTTAIQMRRKLDLKGFAAYLRLFRTTRFDVIHGHFSPDFTLPAYAARMTRQPLTVMTRHVATRWPGAKAKAYARLWNHIIPVSHAVERRLLESGIPPSQMTVAKAGLPAPVTTKSRESARRDLGLKEGQFAVGSFGRLVPEKGIEILIDAIDGVLGAVACIFGQGPAEALLKYRAEGKSVRFYGQVAEIADAMAAVDLVAIPSTWEEPFPYAALEAMALARPIVASRIGGLPELIDEGVNGLLFAPGDPDDLARALTKLGSSDYGRSRGEAGKRRYDAEFTLEHMTSRIEAVYEAAQTASSRS
jgi:glycosyltransferase involved in cell wall biosynthesis